MATLHVNLHNNGASGICNSIISIQIGVILRELGGFDHLALYYSKTPYLFPDQSNILEAIDLGGKISLVSGSFSGDAYNLPSTHTTAFFFDQEPDKDFLNGRGSFNSVNLAARFGDCYLHESLGYYSYIFSLTSHEREVVQDLIFSGNEINFKKDIFDKAVEIWGKYGLGMVVHVRRGDYNSVGIAKNANFSPDDLLKSISNISNSIQFTNRMGLFVMTDEKDKSYFDPLKNAVEQGFISGASSFHFLDDIIAEEYPELPSHLIPMVGLVASVYARSFVGTMYSTLTGLIHQMRHYSIGEHKHRFLFSQDDSLKLKIDGSIDYGSFGTYSWNRLSNPASNSAPSDLLKSILFWAFEHLECAKAPTGLDYAIKISPGFLSKQECRYIISQFVKDGSDNSRENRDRSILQVSDPVISKIVDRVSRELKIDRNRFDTNVQFFKQYEGGQTFLHCDSLFEDYKGRRVGSVLFYLNTNFTGSDIRFPYSAVTITPTDGAMITYPLIDDYGIQSKHFAHEAGVITKGTKYMCYLSIKER